jgi:molybdate transport system substrate-binding protein
MKRRRLGLMSLLGLTLGSAVGAQETPRTTLRVLCSNGVRSALEQAQPQLEATVGATLDIEFSTAAALARRIRDGEAFDVAILTPPLIEALIAEQKIAADAFTRFARTGVGIGARSGASAAITNLAEFEHALRAAESVAFTAEGQSRAAIDAAFAHLGITDIMQNKTVLLGPGEAPGAVAAGQAELVLTLISEIVPVPGLTLLGPFPAEVQSYVEFAAGVSASANDPAARSLLAALGSASMQNALRARGLEAVEAK